MCRIPTLTCPNVFELQWAPLGVGTDADSDDDFAPRDDANPPEDPVPANNAGSNTHPGGGEVPEEEEEWHGEVPEDGEEEGVARAREAEQQMAKRKAAKQAAAAQRKRGRDAAAAEAVAAEAEAACRRPTGRPGRRG